MKTFIVSASLILISFISAEGQAGRTNVLEDLENTQSRSAVQENGATATTTRSTRLFGAKDDLTTVIVVIPSGSVVNVLGSDSTYLQVSFEENEGYIFSKHATLDKPKTSQSQFNPKKVSEEAQNQHNAEARNQNQNQYTQQNQQNQNNNQNQQNQFEQQDRQGSQNQGMNRFSYLENKYGTNIAARLISGKIWKGMNSEMVTDSWGKAQKINRVINGNTIREEWIYRNSWLYFDNDELVEWGPAKR